MRNEIVMLCACAAWLSGCGNGKTGQLEAGGAIGVAYATPTRSGVTDGNGTFRYLSGETVSFSIGQVALGSAPGAAKISLFALAGLTAPATESALRRELELAQSVSTPFRRAINLTRFLMALDADGNPANGIDARRRGSTLANTTIDFDLRVQEFARMLDRRVPDLTHNLPLWVPVAHLYRMSNVMVPAHALTRLESGNSLGTGLYSQLKSYDAAGNIASESVDVDGDGMAESRHRYTYDALGRRLTFKSEWDRPYAGEAQATSAQYSFDARGVALGSVQEVDNQADGVIDERYTADNAHDRFGNITTGTYHRDINGDGRVDVREATVFTYDARNLAQSLISSVDNLADGVVDAKAITRATYDTQERMTSLRYEFDEHADGVVDFGRVERFDYSRTGGTERFVYEDDSDLDGDIDFRYVQTTEYDAAGNAIRLEYGSDFDGDGVIEWRDRTDNVFRPDRRLQSSVSSVDSDGDGIFAPGTREQHEYDAAGTRRRVTRRVIDPGGSGGPGVSIGVFVSRSEYGPDGELQSSVTGFDFDNDDTPDSAETTLTTTYTVVSDGVLLLAREYFSFGGALSLQLQY